jgi:hypothetical protein
LAAFELSPEDQNFDLLGTPNKVPKSRYAAGALSLAKQRFEFVTKLPVKSAMEKLVRREVTTAGEHEAPEHLRT